MMEQIKSKICQDVFRFTLQTQIEQQETPRRTENTQEVHQSLDQFGGTGESEISTAPTGSETTGAAVTMASFAIVSHQIMSAETTVISRRRA